MKPDSCYMCDEPATSREHVPPRCLFPRAEEVGVDLRRNLITVPSCDEHNSEKSHDDEYFRAMLLSATAHHSEIAADQFLGKLLRAVERAPSAYGKYLNEIYDITGVNEKAVRLDRARFDRCVEHLAKALLYHEVGTRWPHSVSVASPNLFQLNENQEAASHGPSENAVSVAREYLGNEPIRGENQVVFKYRLRCESSFPCFGFAAQFYDAFEVFAFSTAAKIDGAA